MKIILLVITAVLLANYSNAQQQLQNSGFEDWDDAGTLEEEPTNWSSLKTADALASMAPEVLSRVPGRTGSYAIQLEVKSVLTIAANGIITNGRVHADFDPEKGYVFTDANNPKWHTAFTDRPDSIVGWYKYNPVSGDKGKIEIILHRGIEGRLPRNVVTSVNEIGNVRYDFVTPETNWTRFSKEFTYYNQDNPDYVLATIASGDSTKSKTGSILIVDDLELIYNTVGVESYKKHEMAINGSQGFLYFDIEEGDDVHYRVGDVTGKIIQLGKASTKIPFRHETGIYFIQVETHKEIFTKKLYIQQ